MRFDLVGGSDRVLTGGRGPQEEVLYAESDSGRVFFFRNFWRGFAKRRVQTNPPNPPPWLRA